MKKVAVFLFEGVELFEIASFTDIFGWNNIVGLKEFRDIKVETISYKESIKCTWGGNLRVEKVITEENIEEFFCFNSKKSSFISWAISLPKSCMNSWTRLSLTNLLFYKVRFRNIISRSY